MPFRRADNHLMLVSKSFRDGIDLEGKLNLKQIAIVLGIVIGQSLVISPGFKGPIIEGALIFCG